MFWIFLGLFGFSVFYLNFLNLSDFLWIFGILWDFQGAYEI